MNNNEYDTVVLFLEDGPCECAVVRIFPAGDNDYVALLPLEGPDSENDEVYLYRYIETATEPTLEPITSDEEYDLVSEAFEEELDAMEYEDLYSEEDDDDFDN